MQRASPTHRDDDLTKLVVSRRTSTEVERLARAIEAAAAWLGPEIEAAPEGLRRYAATLRLRVSDKPRLVAFAKAAYLDFGAVRPLDAGWQAEVGWRAASLAPLFPVFSGTIVARGGEVTVSGWYAPPGGAIGRVADRVLLRIAAMRTARWLLDELIDAATVPDAPLASSGGVAD